MTEQIKQLVSNHYNIPTAALESLWRFRELTVPRQVAIVLTRDYTDLSLKAIGKEYGDRDHSTVSHALELIPSLRTADAELKKAWIELVGKIEAIETAEQRLLREERQKKRDKLLQSRYVKARC